MEEIAAEHGISAECGTIVDGSPVDILPEMASERSIDIGAIGAIARGPAFNFFIGSTAERGLGRLSCDALIVKGRPLRSFCGAPPMGRNAPERAGRAGAAERHARAPQLKPAARGRVGDRISPGPRIAAFPGM